MLWCVAHENRFELGGSLGLAGELSVEGSSSFGYRLFKLFGMSREETMPLHHARYRRHDAGVVMISNQS